MKIVELNLESLDLKYERLSVRRASVERRLLGSLGESGQQSPVIVVAGAEAGRYVVVDGHKRVRALKRLKADVAKAAILEMTEAEALATAYQWNAEGKREAFEEGWLVAELYRQFGWSLGDIARRLVRSKSWVSKRLSLVEDLPEWMSEAVAEGSIGAHAAANYLAPLTRVNGEDGRRLMERMKGLALSDRQWGEIYACYRTSNATARRKIVEAPELFLKARQAAKQSKAEAGLDEKQQRCVNNLELIGKISLGLARNLPEALNYDTTTAALRRLESAWRSCLERFELLSGSLMGLMEAEHAGQGTADGDIGAARERQEPAGNRAVASHQPQ